jgi:hypothetical protein
MPLHCTIVDAGRQIGGYPIRQYKPPPYPLRAFREVAFAKTDKAVQRTFDRLEAGLNPISDGRWRVVAWRCAIFS